MIVVVLVEINLLSVEGRSLDFASIMTKIDRRLMETFPLFFITESWSARSTRSLRWMDAHLNRRASSISPWRTTLIGQRVAPPYWGSAISFSLLATLALALFSACRRAHFLASIDRRTDIDRSWRTVIFPLSSGASLV
jgi:hypothetical protein